MSLIANALARLADIFDFNQYSNRNLFVDGAKDKWNIAAGASAAAGLGGYGPCVLQILSAGTGGTANYVRGTAGPAWTSRLGWPHAPGNYGQFNQTVASTGTLAARTGPVLAMRIEDVNIIDGSSITFSVWLNNPGASPLTITQLSAIQNFGTGGSPSANAATLYPVNWVVPAGSSTWTRFSARLDIPSAVGKTMGTTNTVGWTQIEIDLPVGSTYSIADCFWQAELCSPDAPATGTPTAFEYRGQAAELARTERYYEDWITGNFASGGVNVATTAYMVARFRVPKRITPTVTPGGTFNFFSSATGNQSITGPSVSPAANSDSVLLTATITGGTPGQGCILTSGGAGCSIVFDARM